MNSRQLIFLELVVFGLSILVAFLTDQQKFLGFFLGFAVGALLVQWLFKDMRKAITKELAVAVRIYILGFFSRLGIVTCVIIFVCRSLSAWTLPVVMGLAMGIILPLVLVIKDQYAVKGGER